MFPLRKRSDFKRMTTRANRRGRRSVFERRRSAQQRDRIKAARMLANMQTSGFVGTELKFLDQNIEAQAISTDITSGAILDPATVNCIGCPAQGDGQSNRDGRRYTVKRITIKGVISMAETEVLTDPEGDIYVRIALVQDTQTNAAQAAATSIYADPGGSVLDVIAFRNLANSKRFKVLKEHLVIVKRGQATMFQAANSFAAAITLNRFTIDVKLNVPVQCTSTTGNVTNVADNSFHLVALAFGSPGLLTYVARTRFVG